MTLPVAPAEPVPRHHLVFVSKERWREVMAARHDLAHDPVVATWVERGWPLIARRPDPTDPAGLALGLPLPPSLGKGRIAVTLPPGDVVATRPPPLLAEARVAAPAPWSETLERVAALAARHGGPARVFGSLAWQAITGLPYLSAGSDLDLLLPCAGAGQVKALAAGIAAIDAAAPMRIDAELVRPDGAAVHWREWQAGSEDVLVKSLAGVTTRSRRLFLEGLSA